MSPHATAETLSAYIDRQLGAAEARRVEEHLSVCSSCQERFTGMRRVVAGLKHLERMAPSPVLGEAVTRRIALDGDRTSLLDRLEGGLGIFERQSSLLALFGLVIALAVIMLIFAQALGRDSLIPVVFQDPPAAAAESRELAGRTFERVDGMWVEEGVDARLTRIVVVDSAAWAELVAEYPEFGELAALDGPVIVFAGGEALRIEAASAKTP